jgi:hypothetical protein
VKERPILFSGPMVRALLDGTKTQTRRLAKGVAEVRDGVAYRPEHTGHGTRGPFEYACPIDCPYGVPGDRLWVRETWHPCDGGPIYAADYPYPTLADAANFAGVPRWYPAIHMRREDSRLDLEITAVRVERLHDITEDDARAEGFPLDPVKGVPGILRVTDARTGKTEVHKVRTHDFTARGSFCHLWDGINGKRAPWASNPWVWVVSFKRVRP